MYSNFFQNEVKIDGVTYSAFTMNGKMKLRIKRGRGRNFRDWFCDVSENETIVFEGETVDVSCLHALFENVRTLDSLAQILGK